MSILAACGRTLADDVLPPSPVADASGVEDAPDDVSALLPDVVEAGVEVQCPAGMVRATSFCIDAREVSVAEYELFLAQSMGDAGGLDGGGLDAGPPCAWKLGITPLAGFPPASQPVVGVDWCDATFYCLAAGKRLCGSVDSTPLSTQNPASGQWFIACSRSGAQAFPYGNSFDRERCNAKPNALASVDRDSGCSGGYDGLVDMSGNAREWEDNCEQTGGKEADRKCLTRGGSIAHDKAADLSCGMALENTRKEAPPDVGFRCCWP